jgi:hypothetical protein
VKNLKYLGLLAKTVVLTSTALLAMIATFTLALAAQIIWACALLFPTMVSAALAGFMLGMMNCPEPKLNAKSIGALQWVAGWPLLGEIKLIEGTWRLVSKTLDLPGSERAEA